MTLYAKDDNSYWYCVKSDRLLVLCHSLSAAREVRAHRLKGVVYPRKGLGGLGGSGG